MSKFHRRRASGADWLCALRGLMIDYIASSHASRRLGLSGMCASRRTSSAQAMDGCYCAPKVGAGRGVGIDWIPCATAEQLASMTPTTMTRNTQKSSQAAHCIPKKPKNPASVAEPAVLPRPVGNHWAPFHHHLPSGERCGPGRRRLHGREYRDGLHRLGQRSGRGGGIRASARRGQLGTPPITAGNRNYPQYAGDDSLWTAQAGRQRPVPRRVVRPQESRSHGALTVIAARR